MDDLIYLDHNATTPVLPEVLEDMLPYFSSDFGNAASHTNRFGRQAHVKVDDSLNSIAQFLSCDSSELVITSGATESINLAIKGVFEKYTSKGKHFITCVTEHKAVIDTFKAIEKKGAEVDYLGVDANGLIDLMELQSKLRPDTVMVSIMLANNETGVIQKMPSIAKLVHDNDSIMMSDITQAFGKMIINFDDLGIDLATFSAHKFYGPKGIGGLFVRRKNPRVVLEEQINGGGHQKVRRSGTINVAGLVGMSSAINHINEDVNTNSRLVKDAFEQLLNEQIDVKIIGSESDRLLNTSMVMFLGVKAERLITKCPDLNMAMGSACTSASREPSHVLKAMGLSDEESAWCIRFSFGRLNYLDQVKEIVQSLVKGIQAVQN
jgi:cysteine desulfurase